jgi:hypothetical protein
MRYDRQEMKTFTANLSNGKSVKVSAPSSQRALARVEKLIAQRGSTVTVVSVI